MNSILKPFKTLPTPLFSLFIVITTVLITTLVYQQFFSPGVIDFSSTTIWIAIAVPSGVFASIFLQIRANHRARRIAQQVHSRVAQLEANSRLSNDPRRPSKANLDRPFPEKDPFENL